MRAINNYTLNLKRFSPFQGKNKKGYHPQHQRNEQPKSPTFRRLLFGYWNIILRFFHYEYTSLYVDSANPISFTSSSRLISNFSNTVFRASAISSTTSVAVAPPRLTIKFACLSEIRALPRCMPLRPACSISFAANVPGGFLNMLPEFGKFNGCD